MAWSPPGTAARSRRAAAAVIRPQRRAPSTRQSPRVSGPCRAAHTALSPRGTAVPVPPAPVVEQPQRLVVCTLRSPPASAIAAPARAASSPMAVRASRLQAAAIMGTTAFGAECMRPPIRGMSAVDRTMQTKAGGLHVTHTVALHRRLGVVLAVSACTNPYDPGQRAVGGGLIGAGAGAAIGGAVGGWPGAGIGALVGGAAGAVTGVVTTPPPPSARYYSPPPPPSARYYSPPPPPAGSY